MRKYIAEVGEDGETVKYEIEGWGKTPQDFHKTVITKHIKWPREDIINIFNEKGKRVFNIRKCFSGS